ncbi:MAG: SGNH/GDSL hydrolase family protein [Planctomycetota bacterium]|nr:SGNH/GDSL hydrolase family protein [Planctomycetota bacterium]
MRLLSILILLCWGAASSLQADSKTPQDPGENAPLPRVLIIGDSISIGYTPFVQKALRDRATVIHNPGNAQHTGTGLKKIDQWLGDENWDVIHFNWGLWDLCYRDPPGSRKQGKEKGQVTLSLQQYGINLEKLILRLQKTKARLIWASITRVPEGEKGRFVGDDIRYNRVAQKLMKKYKIPINDLHAVSSKLDPKLFRAPGDVHFKPEGREELAKKVIEAIDQALTMNSSSGD